MKLSVGLTVAKKTKQNKPMILFSKVRYTAVKESGWFPPELKNMMEKG